MYFFKTQKLISISLLCVLISCSTLSDKNSESLVLTQCRGGDVVSCHNAAFILTESKRESEAKPLYEQACAAEYVPSCVNLGNLERDLGNKIAASNAFEISCKKGMMRCNDYAVLQMELGHVQKALRLHKTACHQGDSYGCYNLGLYNDANGNIQEARIMYEKACADKVSASCYDLAMLEYENANVERSLQFYSKSCELGMQKGCQNQEMLNEKLNDKYSTITQKNFLKKVKRCKAQDIVLFLPPLSQEPIRKDTLYYGQMNIIQKIENGFLMMTKLSKGNGIPDPVIFVEMNPKWSGRTYSGWLYLVGDYEYVAIDGFKRRVPNFKVYDGHLRVDACERGIILPCKERDMNGCF